MKIPAIPLIPAPDTDEAREALGFKWNDGAGKAHRLGGDPEWIQSPEPQSCPECRQPMSFYAQLDSIGDEFSLADCGMIYVFVCFGCFTAVSTLQSY